MKTASQTPPQLKLVAGRRRRDLDGVPTLGELLLDYAGLEPGARAVEFTFGPPRFALHMQGAGCHVETVDLAVYGIDSLPREWLRRFDVAVVTSALHQAADPGSLLAEIAACIRPGGLCAGLEPAYGLDLTALESSARSAGLSLVDLDRRLVAGAIVWRGRVPGLRVLPRPAAAPVRSFMPLAA